VIVVLDASVILKWLLGDPDREPDTDKAFALVDSVVRHEVDILQPVHWLAEVAAVMARLSPQTAVGDVQSLSAMQFPTMDDVSVISRATVLAVETQHHLFDTLYHAVALENEDATLITADDRYRRKSERHGRIVGLHDWTMPPSSTTLR
jgi:predicted nucleic acid-binding protein